MKSVTSLFKLPQTYLSNMIRGITTFSKREFPLMQNKFTKPPIARKRNFTTLEDLDLLRFKGVEEPGAPLITITGVRPSGFLINNVYYHGPVILFPKLALFWKNVTKQEDITMETLAPVFLHYPPIRLLFIGTGDEVPNLPAFLPIMTQLFEEKGISCEVMGSVQNSSSMSANEFHQRPATHTFNIVNSEARDVAVCMLPYDPNIL